MNKTRVVNLKHILRNKEKYDVYCGRPGPFGNRFIIGKDGTREQVLEKYREYFYARLKIDNDFRNAIHELKGKRLACWCKPEKCHCDIIAEYLDKHADFSD